MNVLELYTIYSPYGKSEECAKLSIYDTAEWFVFSDTTATDVTYTFSAWIKSDAAGGLTVGDSYIQTTTEWIKCKSTFTADSVDLKLIFGVPGTYYLYNTQLEVGTIATDWSPSPEDLDPEDAISDTNERIQTVYNFVSELSIENNEIKASVSSIETTIDTVTNDVVETKSEIAAMKLESDELKLSFQEIANGSANRVETETGFTFDRNGMTIDSTDSPTKTQVTPDGMTVYKKDADGVQEEVLEATSEGVDATNLHAKTYLIIGGRSRFENYGTNRTGCFWIGG